MRAIHVRAAGAQHTIAPFARAFSVSRQRKAFVFFVSLW
jgi:hypothetical protein